MITYPSDSSAAAYMRAYRRNNTAYYERTKANQRTIHRALRRLRDAHPDEFAAYLAAERAAAEMSQATAVVDGWFTGRDTT